jgi:beta-glucosidase
MPWADHPNIKAIVLAGLPGQESGNSLADVLFGDVNPSAKLPYTIARDVKDYPATINKNLEVKKKKKNVCSFVKRLVIHLPPFF